MGGILCALYMTALILPVPVTITLSVLWIACYPKVMDVVLSYTRWSCLEALPPSRTGSNTVWWHVSMAPPTAFEGGVDLKRGRTHFLGPGFYVWTTVTAARRYVPHRAPQSLLKITAPQNLVEALHVVSIPNKWSWAYWRALYLWHLRGLVWTLGGQERLARYREKAWRNADVVIAPALGAPASSQQLLLRDTQATRTLLAAARIEHWDVTPSWSKRRPVANPPALD